VLFIVGLIFAKVGGVCAELLSPVIAFFFPWDVNQIAHWIVAGSFSVIGICAGKIVEIYAKDYLRRKRRRAPKHE